MQINATLALSADDRKELSRILNIAQRDLAEALAGYASAALKEYVTMFLGQKVFRRGSDLLEYRLCLLIEGPLNNQIPDEERVCGLFQTTATESRSLIRSVMSKYQYHLKSAIERSMQSVLRAARSVDDGSEFTVTVNSLNVIDELNRVLAEIDGNLPRVIKKRGSVSTHVIAASSYTRLCERLGVEPLLQEGD
jgi:hypothetical protein